MTGTSRLAAAEAFRLAVTAIVAVVLARRTGTAAFGVWTVALAITGYPLAMVEAGLTWIGTREISRNPGAAASLVRTIVPIRVGLALAGVAAVAVFAYAVRISALERHVILIAALSLLTMALTLDWVFYGLEQPSTVAAAAVTRAAVFGSTTLLLIDRPDRIWLAPLLQACAEFVGATQLAWNYRRRVKPAVVPTSVAARHLLRQSSPLALAQLMRAISAWSSVTIVALLLSTAAAGSFGAAQRLTQLTSGFAVLYFYGYLPLVSRAVAEGRDAVRTLIARSLRLALLVAVAVALGIAILANPLIGVIFGRAYQEAVPVLRIFVWTVPIAVVAGHFRHTLIASHLTHLDLVAVTAGALTTLALNATLIAPLGLRGGALATVVGELVVALTAIGIVLRVVLVKSAQPT